MTGHWCNSTGVWHTIGGRSLLRKQEYTLPQALGDEFGYATGIFGKWHLGDEYPYRPQDRGFTTTLCHGGGGVGQQPDWWGNDYFDDTYHVNGVPKPFEGYCTDVFFREATKFMKDNVDRDTPFFCYLATNAPHEPFNVSKEYRDLYKDDTKTDDYARFLGMITNIDDNFGTLKQNLHDWGIEDNTILVFMSDNGQIPIRSCSPGEQYNSGMRGFKGSEYEGGHRIPFALRYPAMGIDNGLDVTTLASYVDVMPTLLDLVHGNSYTLPKGREAFHGCSLKPLLLGSDNELHESDFWTNRIAVADTQRIPNPMKWKQCSVMQSSWRLVNKVELYDIAKDPGQTTNVIKDHPERVDILMEGYETWWKLCQLSQDFETPIALGGKERCVTLRSHDMRNDNGDTVWSQALVRQGVPCWGWWEVLVECEGDYEFGLQRWPKESHHALREGIRGTDIVFRKDDVSPRSMSNYVGGKALDIRTASLRISKVGEWSKDVHSDEDVQVTFDKIHLEAGLQTQVRAFFQSNAQGYYSSPYYVYVKKVD